MRNGSKSILSNKERMKKIIFIPVILFAVAALFFFTGCSREKINAPDGVPVLVVKSVETNVPVQIDPPPVGHVMPVQTVTIHSQIGGIISEVHFKEGSEVKSNALLFTIDPRPMQAVLARDQALLTNAGIQFDREQKLFDQKLVSQDEFDTSKAARDTLAATVQSDELNLEFTEIRAPFDGVTGSLQFHEGNVVKAPDDTLLTINQIHPIYVVFAVPEQFLPEIKKQMREKPLKVSVTYQNMTVPPPQGDLTFVDNAVDETTGTILLKATFPNEDDALWPGQFVEVELTLSELTDAVVVPSQAVQVGQNGQFVYVVNADQAVEMRPVKTGIAFNSETVIETGLKAGETVVTDGQLRLAPKMKVTVKSPDSASKTNAP
jgi:membrane fusion protein, multidrug efflux system